MALCPIKMLKDELGQQFVPYTHMRAVSGGTYVSTTFDATQNSAGQFTIDHDDMEEKDLLGKVVSINFPTAVSTSTSGYKLRFKTGTYHMIYADDGVSQLDLNKFIGTTCFLKKNASSWQLIRTGVIDATHPGHTILDANGNTLTQRNNLQFNGMSVSDSSGITAVAPLVINNLTTTTSGNGALDAAQGKVLNDKFSNYLLKSGGTLTGTLTGTTIKATTFEGTLSGKATTAGTADKVATNLTLKQNNVSTVYNGESAKSLNIPTVHSGIGTPSNSTGQDGDIYILII